MEPRILRPCLWKHKQLADLTHLEYKDYIFHVDNGIMSMLTAVTIFAFVLGIIAVILGSFILMIKRFYDNMLKDEGYLSFTLPVSVGQHIASKSIISYVWMILSFVFVGLMLVILGLGDNELIGAIKDVFSEAVKMIQETNSMKYVVEVIVMLLLTAVLLKKACKIQKGAGNSLKSL